MAMREQLVTSDTTQTIPRRHPPAGVGFDWAFLVPCSWLMIGISLDGWAHNHIPALETFFTLWHGVLYSGYLAVAAFLLAVLVRNQRRGTPWQHAVPAGYGLSLLGVGIFAVGGVLDLIWHVLFGIERNVETLLSPTHLLLALEAVLMVGGPLRAVWYRLPTESTESRSNLFPMLLFLAYILVIFTFFTQFANPIANSYADQHTIEPLEDLGIVSNPAADSALHGRCPVRAAALALATGSVHANLCDQ